MPDADLQNQRFEELFRRWRGEASEKETAFLNTARLINKLTSNQSISALKNALEDEKSPMYLRFNEFGVFKSGTCLFASLSIDDYCRQCESLTEPERSLLTQLSGNFKKIFQSPREQVNQNVTDILMHASQWLREFAPNSASPEHQKALFIALYTTLRVLSISLKNLNFILKRFVQSQGIEVEQKIAELAALANEIERLNEALDTPEVIEEPLDRVSLEDHLDKACCKVYDRTDLSPSAKAIVVIEELDKLEEDIKTCIQIKLQKERLMAESGRVLNFLQALRENNQRVVGRQYVLDFVRLHESDVSWLIQEAEPSVRLEWEERFRTLKSPDTMQQLRRDILFTLSAVSAPVSALTRYFAPRLHESISSLSAFETYDGECKKRLEEMALAKLSAMEAELQTLSESSNNFTDKYSPDNAFATTEFQEASAEAMISLLQRTQAKKRAMVDHRAFYELYENQQKKSSDLSKIERAMAAFIQQNTGFLCRIYVSFPGAAAAEMSKNLHEIEKMYQEIQELKPSYRLNFKMAAKEMKRREHHLLGHVITSAPKVAWEEDSKDESMYKGVPISFAALKEMYQKFKEPLRYDSERTKLRK